MKKLLSFALILMVCCTSALLFAGCDKNTEFMTVTNGTSTGVTDNKGREIKSFTFTQADYTDLNAYDNEVNAAFVSIEIQVFENKDSKVEAFKGTLAKARRDGAHIAGFSLKEAVVDATATITFKGDSISFKYTVTAKP